jgi:hypothetical protein
VQDLKELCDEVLTDTVEDDKCVELANLHGAPQAEIEAFFSRKTNFLQKTDMSLKPEAERKYSCFMKVHGNENF